MVTVKNGYEVGELTTDNSGFAKWGYAYKDGVEYFIKEFLSPVYPVDDTVLSRTQIEQKRDICKQFEYEKRVFYNELNECRNGNVVTIEDFFRDGSKYYIITRRINAESIEPSQISNMGIDQILLILKVLAHSLSFLHRKNIVHSDIKPNNILFKRTERNVYTAKLIDFDSSFLESNPPESESDFQGDMVYLAPESFLFMIEEEDKLTTKIDVFALGILFHQYLTGDLPGFDKEQYDYAFEAVLDGMSLEVSPAIPSHIREVIKRMLDKNPKNRPTCVEIFDVLNSQNKVGEIKKSQNSINPRKMMQGSLSQRTEKQNSKRTSLNEDDSQLKINMQNTEKSIADEENVIGYENEDNTDNKTYIRRAGDLL